MYNVSYSEKVEKFMYDDADFRKSIEDYSLQFSHGMFGVVDTATLLNNGKCIRCGEGEVYGLYISPYSIVRYKLNKSHTNLEISFITE